MMLCAKEPLAELAKSAEPVASDYSLDPTWTLCVRGTFLDPVTPVAMAKRRSSDPGLHSERPSFFAEEEWYAKQLTEKMNGLGRPTATEELAALSTSAPTPVSARSSCSSVSGKPEVEEQKNDKGEPGPPDAPLPRGLPSSGCIGHPALCRLPCRDAASCRECCGRKRVQHLDKRSRKAISLMSRHDKIEVLCSIMRAKVEELGLGAEASQAFEEWHAEVTTAPPERERSATTLGEVGRLQRCLEALYLNDLCFCVPVPSDVRAASIRLLRRLGDLHAAA